MVLQCRARQWSVSSLAKSLEWAPGEKVRPRERMTSRGYELSLTLFCCCVIAWHAVGGISSKRVGYAFYYVKLFLLIHTFCTFVRA